MSSEAANQISLLNSYIKALEAELNSYKKEIAAFIKYYDLFDNYDSTVSQMQNVKNEKERLKKKIKKMEQKVEYFEYLQKNYHSLQNEYETSMIEKQNILEINESYKSKINELMRKISKLEEQKARQLKIERTNSQSRSSISEVSNESNWTFQSLDQILQPKDGFKAPQQIMIEELKQKIRSLEMQNFKLYYKIEEQQKTISSLSDSKPNSSKKLIPQSHTVSIFHLQENNSSKKQIKQLNFLDKILNLQLELKIQNEAKAQQNKEMRKIKEQLKDVMDENATLRKDIEVLEEKLRQKDNQMKIKQLQLERQSSKNIIMKGDVSKISSHDIQTLQSIIDDQSVFIVSLNKQIKQLRVNEKNNRKIIESLQQSNIMLKKQFSSAIEQSSKLECQILSMKQRKELSQTQRSVNCSDKERKKKTRKLSQYLSVEDNILSERKNMRKSHFEEFKPSEELTPQMGGVLTDRPLVSFQVQGN